MWQEIQKIIALQQTIIYDTPTENSTAKSVMNEFVKQLSINPTERTWKERNETEFTSPQRTKKERINADRV